MKRDLFGDEIIPVDDQWPADFCQRFWEEYPLHVSRKKAEASLWRIRQKRRVEWQQLIAAVRRYRAWLDERRPGTFRPSPKHPTTWLNQECWTDSLPDYDAGRPRTLTDIAMGR